MCCSVDFCVPLTKYVEQTTSRKEILVLVQGFRGINLLHQGSYDRENISNHHDQKTERMGYKKKPGKTTVPQAPNDLLTPFGFASWRHPTVPSYQEFIKALIYSLGPSLCDLDFFGNTPTDPALHIAWIFVNPVSSWQLKLTYLGVSSGRGGLAVKSSCCCWRGPRFESPHQHSCLQPSITLGDPKSSSDFCRYQACTRWIYIHTGKILLHIK